MWELDPDDTRPPYAQVADALRRETEQGVLQPGMKLPTHQQLASQYGVSIGTVKRALGELQGAGLIISRQGQGTFVRTRRATRETATEEHADVEALSKQVRELREEIYQLRDLTARGEKTGLAHGEREQSGELQRLCRKVELISSHLIALYERVGQPYPYDSLNEFL